ncbi:glycosyltransferase family 4 protein [Clostridium manihotivorum]|uniref:Glycosyltransferase family 1 protein n=1 Tax=Clostridium manihotivorum TaxID=2320868 RepID=A0A410E154_9CLOT|nr:glycosyltransferase family 4 protein [Clostridium manihotivorum]QAA35033.1 hypothetical protein C1I91_27175 [Clostridium manihotivorum]
MKGSRILHVVATDRLSGAEKVVSDICTNLSNKFSAIVVCSGGELKQYYEERGLKVYLADVNRISPMEIIKIKNILKEENINLVHAHDVKASIASQIACGSLNIPVISHIHVNYTWMKDNKLMSAIDKHFRRKYSLSIACSELVKKYYLDNNDTVNKEKITYLDNAFNFNEFNKINLGDTNKLRDVLKISEKDFVFGYLGRLIEIKGVDLLIESFSNIAREHSNVKLLIVGDGTERVKLEKLVKNLNVEESVIFTGYQKNTYDYMELFDCFILPSIREGLPIAMLEAMAMRKAVISTAVAGVVKLIDSGYNGLILKNRNEKELIEAMISLLNDNEKKKQLAENAYNCLKDNYDINNYVEKLEVIYSRFI